MSSTSENRRKKKHGIKSSTSETSSVSPLTMNSTRKSSSSIKIKKRNTLKTFGKTVKSPRMLAQLLGKLCTDTGSCLTFGKYVKPTKKLFGNFLDFKNANPNMSRIGKQSFNGFIYEITYENQGIKANSILKCSQIPDEDDASKDNLFYEFLVGHFFINKCNMRFPCFLETYNAYNIDNDTVSILSERKTFEIENLEKSIKRLNTFTNIKDFSDEFRISCKNQYNICILIQHIKATYTLESYNKIRYKYYLKVDKNYTNYLNYYNYELPQLLYQIYAPLANLGNTFTHYDLHRENVLIYYLAGGKYVIMNYIFPDGTTVSFKTHLICKMIDYGRSYFYINDTLNSKVVYKNVCDICIDENKPENTCGFDNGYSFLKKREDLKKQYYILSSEPNISHDLRLLEAYKDDELTPLSEIDMKQIFLDLHCETIYGTPEHPDSEPNKIYNINDAEVRLRELILEPKFITENNEQYKDFACVGKFNIYMDSSSKKSMDFEPVY